MWANMTLDTETLTDIWLQKLKWKVNVKYTVRMLILTWTRFCRVWQPQYFVLLLLLLAVIRIPHDSAMTPVSLCSRSFVMTQGAPSPFLPLSRCHYQSALFMSHSNSSSVSVSAGLQEAWMCRFVDVISGGMRVRDPVFSWGIDGWILINVVRIFAVNVSQG